MRKEWEWEWERDKRTIKFRMPPRASRHRIDLNDADFALLEEVAEGFGLSKSETVRRLLRAALNIGPALSEENSQVVAGMADQLRRVGRNLMQMLKAIHGGRVVQIEDSVEVWQVLHERVSAMDKELTRMTEAYGVKLRREVMVDQMVAANQVVDASQVKPGNTR